LMWSAPFLISINFLVLLLLLYHNRKNLKDFFLSIGTKAWLFLLFFFLVGLALRIVLPAHHHRMWTDESTYMEAGKNMMKEFSFGSYDRSLGWPFLLAIVFRIFGLEAKSALYASSVVGALTILTIFFSSDLIMKRKEFSLLPAAIFSMMPLHIIWSGTAETNGPSLFFITLAIFLCFLYLRRKKVSLLWLALAAVAFASYFRPENFVLFAVFLAGCVLFDRKTIMRLRLKFFLPWAFFLAISLANFAIVVNTYVPHNQFEAYSRYGISGQNFGISNLVSNSYRFGRYIFDDQFQPELFLCLIVLGALYMFWLQKRELFFLTVWVLLFWLVYFASWFQIQGATLDVFPKTRFFMMFYPVTLIWAAYGGLAIYDFLRRKFRRKVLRNSVLMFEFLVILAVTLPYTLDAAEKPDGVSQLATDMPDILEKDIPSGCLVVTYMPVVVTSVTDLKVASVRNYLGEPDKFLNLSCVLFYEDFHCLYNTEMHDPEGLCARLRANHSMSMVKSYGTDPWKFYLYKLN
jgi:4-amino-4-deoxy-L-arabinose transferase-like glycosyltransferase